MDISKISDFNELVKDNSYPGRGIIIGKTPDSKNAVIAYFIMGRSVNSRNRKFVKKNDCISTEPIDTSKLEDPSLIIYNAVRNYKNNLIVTNGDQTDTIYESLINGKTFIDGLRTREHEPDDPNFTPRISGMLTFNKNDFNYSLSILKSADNIGSKTLRYFFECPSINGEGHFIHTYLRDGNPIPSFQGEPRKLNIDNNIKDFTEEIWNSLDKDNKVSLYVRYINLDTMGILEEIRNNYI